jgi:hypothetical protein
LASKVGEILLLLPVEGALGCAEAAETNSSIVTWTHRGKNPALIFNL